MNERNYTLSLKCTTSDGSLYAISQDDFFSPMKRDEKAWKILNNLQEIGDKKTIGKIIKNSSQLRKIKRVEKNDVNSMTKYKHIIE